MTIIVESDVSEDWTGSNDWASITAYAAEQAVLESPPHQTLCMATVRVEISVRLTSDAEVHDLNARFRSRDKPTNVLSFPMFEPDDLDPVDQLYDEEEVLLGDIVVAYGVCEREAAEKSIPVADHLTHLVVHGTLHLLGYDHETSDEDAEEMEEIERRALASLGIKDPYQVTEVDT